MKFIDFNILNTDPNVEIRHHMIVVYTTILYKNDKLFNEKSYDIVLYNLCVCSYTVVAHDFC